MHRFHQSRGRILFEVACALTVSASCVGAWIQTGATALLPAAATAALYAVVHLFDMARPRPQLAADLPMEEPVAEAAPAIQLVESVEPAPVKTTKSRRKPARKATRPKVAEAVAVSKARVLDEMPIEAAPIVDDVEPVVAEDIEAPPPADEIVPIVAEEIEAADPLDDDAPIPIAPLFEPEPFVRQQRAVFGRKAG